MSKNLVTFYLNKKGFKFSCTKEILEQIPSQNTELWSQLFQYHCYEVQSPVQDETFQSFLDFWQNKTTIKFNVSNIWEYYLLSNEFGIMKDYISSPQFENLFNISYLILPEHESSTIAHFATNFNKSSIEEQIAKHLSDYLAKSPSDLFQIPISNLYNIFNHPENNLQNHEEAYNMILDEAKKQNKNDLFILLGLLDGSQIKSDEVRSNSIFQKDEHFGFFPRNISPSNELNLEFTKIQKLCDQLTTENNQLKSEYDQLSSENIKIKKDNDKLTNENQKINNICDQLAAEKEKLKKSYDQLAIENQNIKNMCNQLEAEKEKIKNTYSQLTIEKMELENLNDQFSTENEKIKNDISQIKSENQQLNECINQLKDKIKQMKTINCSTDTSVVLRPLRNCIHDKRSPNILIERTTINNKLKSKGVLSDLFPHLFSYPNPLAISYFIEYNQEDGYVVKYLDIEKNSIKDLPPYFNVQVRPHKGLPYRVCTILKDLSFNHDLNINKECISFAIKFGISPTLDDVYKTILYYFFHFKYSDLMDDDEYRPLLFTFVGNSFVEIDDVKYIDENQFKPIFIVWSSTEIYDFVMQLFQEYTKIKAI